MDFYTTDVIKCGGKNALVGMTTTEVNDQALKPLTYYRQVSYCGKLNDLPGSGVGPAEVFISHAWKYKFLDVVEALQNHLRGEPNAIIWFDLFSNNQHCTPDLDFNWWSSAFKGAIETIGRTVIARTPRNNPLPLKRPWCLLGFYCTIGTRRRFEVAMSEIEYDEFIRDVSDDCGVVDQMIEDVCTRNSEAGKADEKVKILILL